jgi:hypothetical protein
MPVAFPQRHVAALHKLAVRLIDSRKPRSELDELARNLLLGFFDACTHAGLDHILVELAAAYPPVDASDRSGLADHDGVRAALVARIEAIDLDGGGPRNVRPKQLSDCVLAALDLAAVDEPDRSISLGDDVRAAVAVAIAGVVDVELAAATLREAIIADARARCEDRLHSAFGRIVAQLDERGLQLAKIPKVPIDALHAVQRVLGDARDAVIARVANTAIDRAKDVLVRADAEAAGRIEVPITHRATPREVAIARVLDPRVAKTPTIVAHALLDALTELVPIAWRAAERPVQPYAATRTFAVGDVIDHPKFGRGSVVACVAQRIDVEFADGKHTLVHVPPRR